MDAVGAAASLLALIELTAKIGSLCAKYSIAVKNANRDIARLQDEVKQLERILQEAQALYKDPRGGQSIATSTSDCLIKCEMYLSDILEKLTSTPRSRWATKFKLDSLTWPVKKKEVDKLISNLEASKQSLTLAMQIDQLTNIKYSKILKDLQLNREVTVLPIAEGASYDSFSDQLNARCHSGTRVEVRQQIRDWFYNSTSSCLFWLNGMAGTGKSTILRSVAQEWHDQCELGASFFFKRGEGARGDSSRLLTTIASHLIQNQPRLGTSIKAAIRENPQIYDKALSVQFRILILEPLQECERESLSTILIVLDALDECDGEGSIETIVQQFTQIAKITSSAIKILISSRPEPQIRKAFKALSDLDYLPYSLEAILDVTIKHDIEIYLEDELSRIRKQSEFDLPDIWPKKTQIEALLIITENLFIAAATVCRFIGDTRSDPEQQLLSILDYKQVGALNGLDRVYKPVLDQMLAGLNTAQTANILEEFQIVVGSIVVLEDVISVNGLSLLLDTPRRTILRSVGMLHSVLRIPTQDDQPLRLLHLSFRDYLTRNIPIDNQFRVDELKVNKRLASACIRILTLTTCLKKDICNLGDPLCLGKGTRERRALAAIPIETRYACRYWVKHICRSQISLSDQKLICQFLKTKFLYWVEALTLLGYLPEIKHTLLSLQTCNWVSASKKSQSSNEIVDDESDKPGSWVNDFIKDAVPFLFNTEKLLTHSLLQLYTSAIVFTPRKSIIRKLFEPYLPQYLEGLPIPRILTYDSLQPHVGHVGNISCFALSPKNDQFASASDDGSIILWRISDGLQQHVLLAHTDPVYCIAYVMQGSRLTSHCYGDRYIMLWNTQTGRLEQILETRSVSLKVIPSHEGLLLVSWQHYTVELWDLTVCQRVHTLYDPGQVQQVQFSLDDTVVAAYFADEASAKVIIVSVVDRAIVHTLKIGDSFKFQQIAFSPMCESFARNTRHGLQVQSTLDNSTLHNLHKPNAKLGEFSADGSQVIFTTAGDDVLHVWDLHRECLDARYCNCRWPFFLSHDGTFLATGCIDDRNIMVWDTSTNAVKKGPKLTTKWLWKLFFLKDRHCVLIHDGNTIKLWDFDEAIMLYSIRKQDTQSVNLCLSLDGENLASGAHGKGVHIWDTSNGSCVQAIGSEGVPVKFSNSGRYLLCTQATDFEIWNVESGLLRSSFPLVSDTYKRLEFLPDDNHFVLFEGQKEISVWNMISNQHIVTLQDEHSSSLHNMDISANGHQIATSYASSKNVKIWSLPSGSLLQNIMLSSQVESLGFSSSGQNLIANTESQLVLWDLTMRVEMWAAKHEPGYQSFVFSADNKKIAALAGDELKILDSYSGEIIQELYHSKGGTTLLAFSEDMTYLETTRGTIGLLNESVYASQQPLANIHVTSDGLEIEGGACLWLPEAYHPHCCDTRKGKIAFGYPSGEIVLYDVMTECSQSIVLTAMTR